jgi:4a-hydroxytetrahydrobiopterin dehydratase
MTELKTKKCIPCSGGIPPLEIVQISELLGQLENWDVVDNHHLTKTVKFKDFVSALEFTNKVGAIAEAEGHHPDILLRWGSVEITIWTHKIDGLTESDFILAAKIDALS